MKAGEILMKKMTSFDLSASDKLTWLLGWKAEQNLIKGTVHMSQDIHCNDRLTRFKMSDDNTVHTPCEANHHPQASDSSGENKRTIGRPKVN